MPGKLFKVEPRVENTPEVQAEFGLFSTWFDQHLERLASTAEQTALTGLIILHCGAALRKTALQDSPILIPPAAA